MPLPVIALGPVGIALLAGAGVTKVVGVDNLPELGYKAGLFIGGLTSPAPQKAGETAVGASAESAGESVQARVLAASGEGVASDAAAPAPEGEAASEPKAQPAGDDAKEKDAQPSASENESVQ